MTPATTWTDLENKMPSERSQTQKATCCGDPLIRNVQKGRIHRRDLSGGQGLGAERGAMLEGTGLLSGVTEMFWSSTAVTVTRLCEQTKIHSTACFNG